jgi:Ni/Co efflux regulator RcnB
LAWVAFIPAPTLAQSQEEQQACMNDAFTVCGDAIPDRDRVAACLAQNINRVSAPCRTVMARYSKPGTAQARRERVIEQDDRYDRGDQFNRNDRRDRYGRY